ncbi:hypothetical protein BGZ83_007838 [Gryganskiella cystojenkinii]|nr:hypothetical protein BGZ83_007838 [Gryganskiella cystojenkinii]
MRISILALAATAFAVASAAPVEKRATDNNVVVGYWVPWGDVPVANLDMSKYTHINYGFGVTVKTNPDPTTITFDRYYDGNNIKALVTRGNQAGVPILMSIGGWTGSQTFSSISADAGLRKKFINNALVFVRNNTLPPYADTPDGWNMDGIDIDWEYPGRAGAICNIYTPSDASNYLTLLKELRAQLDLEFPNNHKLLTAAVRVQPFDGPNGPLADVSAYAQYFDWISIMAYDIMGSWSATTGPNAPFKNGPAGKADQFSVTQAIDSWTAAKFPANKLVVGTAFYGRSVTTTVNMNTQNPISLYVNKTNVTPKGGPADTNGVNFYCNEGAVYSGLWKWKELRGGPLSGGVTTPGSGWTRYWDDQTQTPWLFNPSSNTFISYDDVQSLTIKVNYAKQAGVKGVMLWDMSYDYNAELITVLQNIHCTSNCPVLPTTTVAPPKTTTGIPSVTPSATSIKTTTASPSPTTTTPSGSGPCAGVAPWSSSQIYATANTKVTYNGHLYTNQWWTQGDTPSSVAFTVWKDGGAC